MLPRVPGAVVVAVQEGLNSLCFAIGCTQETIAPSVL